MYISLQLFGGNFMRALIVDDEMYTREGILEYVDWESFGIEEVMDADDGASALCVADWFCPDIVISDVKMPQMDGITFARKFLDKFPDSKIIFMSAYMEIRYYREAIKLSAVDYVEKPLDMDEMLQAIQKAVRGIEENRKNRDGIKKSKIMLEEQVVNYLINPGKKEEHCRELCQQIGFLHEGHYICFCFKDLEKEDKQVIVTMIDEFFKERRLKSITAKNDGYYCSILTMNSIMKNHYTLQELGQQFTNQYPSFHIGLGFYVDHIISISESWRLARKALNQAFYEPQKTIFEQNILQENASMVDSGIYSRVYHVIMNEPERLSIVINTVLSKFDEAKTLEPASIKAFAKAIILDVMKQKGTEDTGWEEIFWGQTPEDAIDGCESLDEIHQVLMNVSGMLVGVGGFSGNSSMVKRACRHIRKYFYKQDLSLVVIAEECGISTGYLCMIFKKELGITARQFIEEYRIEVAKERLIHTNERVQDISINCGFAQHGYFSRVFKQKTGMTPAEYREKCYE